MPHIFRFHEGRNNNIYDWKASDRIMPGDLSEVLDKTNELSSSAGTSIPSPLARMYLFKTAFEIVSKQLSKPDKPFDKNSIYAGLVSEVLDLIELLYKCGSDESKFRYQKWVFNNVQREDNVILDFFGQQHGHRLLAESFKQAASQAHFNNIIEITLIYYREGSQSQEILVGGTSPFTFVFTSPNFKRKMRDRGFRAISGLVSNDILFDADYKQLFEKDKSFIKYVQNLKDTKNIHPSFQPACDYITICERRFEKEFTGSIPALHEIQSGDSPLSVSNVVLKQISPEDYKQTIQHSSDFKIDLPDDSNYNGILKPLFLLDRMPMDGQYSSSTSLWSDTTKISDKSYPEVDSQDILNPILKQIEERELPGLSNTHYPFLSSFDFFERSLIKLPGYFLNEERFTTLTSNQGFLFPIKPLFFHFFPIDKIDEYISVEAKNEQVTFTLRIPIYGPTKGRRVLVCKKSYDVESTINYSGILGIFPFTRATQDSLKHINKYTISSYEKTNAQLLINAVKFFKKSGIHVTPSSPAQRANYSDSNTKSTYFKVEESFDIIQLNFKKDSSNVGGIIIPKFKEVVNGTAEYIYAIDFGTSNTHIEYGRVESAGNRSQVAESLPFTIEERDMQMYLLNQPKKEAEHDGTETWNDYERSMGTVIETARKVLLREFIPFQVGNQKSASVKFPFRTAMCESDNFISNQANNRLFIDANIGFHIDDDAIEENIRYKTDLKWLLQTAARDPFNISRVSLFIRELMLMIRTKILLEDNNYRGCLEKTRLIFSFPISMSDTHKRGLRDIFEKQREEIFGKDSSKLANDVTESIAPYYQLKASNINIQNDNFCNIDIGGGTTDIVFTNTEFSENNTLQCYCSSFKFAGRQLWSSGSNEFNSNENGFVSYYKDFLKRIDEGQFNKMQNLFTSNKMRTEDIVSFLFSKPDYKFKEIFSDNTELKVVPLIHYAAILFYICKVAKWKNLKLPRTVSFSGKGSEYLNLIFPSNNSLKSFTKKLFSIFTGSSMPVDFDTIRSIEPKVITAKGAVHYAVENVTEEDRHSYDDSASDSNEKTLKLEEITFKGLANSELESKQYSYSNFSEDSELYMSVMNSQLEFFNLLFDNSELCTSINKNLDISDFFKYKSFFIPTVDKLFTEGKLRDSFKATLSTFDPGENATDSPFFFALNYSLIDLSKEIAKTKKN